MDAFHEAVDNGATDLDVYSGGIEENVALIAAAESLAQDIEDAFHAHTMLGLSDDEIANKIDFALGMSRIDPADIRF